MSAFTHDDVLNASLTVISANCTKMTACSQQPTTYTEALTTYARANVTVSSADFSLADGDVSGRKLTFAGRSDGSGTSTGSTNHIAFLDVANTKLLHVIQSTAQDVAANSTVLFSAVDVLEVRDPS
jgi:predicted methyltransferase